MPQEPGTAALLHAWHQKQSALPNGVRAVLAAANLAAERTAAYLRLDILILIGLGLVGLGSWLGFTATGVLLCCVGSFGWSRERLIYR